MNIKTLNPNMVQPTDKFNNRFLPPGQYRQPNGRNPMQPGPGMDPGFSVEPMKPGIDPGFSAMPSKPGIDPGFNLGPKHGGYTTMPIQPGPKPQMSQGQQPMNPSVQSPQRMEQGKVSLTGRSQPQAPAQNQVAPQMQNFFLAALNEGIPPEVIAQFVSQQKAGVREF